MHAIRGEGTVGAIDFADARGRPYATVQHGTSYGTRNAHGAATHVRRLARSTWQATWQATRFAPARDLAALPRLTQRTQSCGVVSDRRAMDCHGPHPAAAALPACSPAL